MCSSDLIGEIPPSTQVKLLRVLEEREVTRVGGTTPIHVDVRVVAATSRDIDQMVQRGEFRRDLFYRINVVRIDLPPLRARGDDIGLLAEHFANKAAAEMGRSVGGLSTDVYQVTLPSFRAASTNTGVIACASGGAPRTGVALALAEIVAAPAKRRRRVSFPLMPCLPQIGRAHV